MEDQYALKPAFWQTSLFCLQNIKIVKTTYDYLLILDNNKSLHFDRQIKLFFSNRVYGNYSKYACRVTQNFNSK